MYNPPIEISLSEIQLKENDAIMKAIEFYDINCNPDELRRALKYDRGQYEKGYADGKRDAVEH